MTTYLSNSPLAGKRELTFDDDLLDRRRFGDLLANLVENTAGGIAIAVDAPWGEGKTTFMHMWRDLLIERGHAVALFDAFEHDQAEDPFIAIASSITETFERVLPTESRNEHLREKAVAAAAHIIRWGAKFTIRLASAGAASNEDIEDFTAAATVASTAMLDLDAEAASLIRSYRSKKTSVERFRQALSKIAQELPRQPLVFIIDELDRCNPEFTVRLLERLKHIFEAPGVTFVLAIHEQQLRASLEQVYGVSFDTAGYLRKFISLTCVLPKYQHNSEYSPYASALIASSRLTGKPEYAYLPNYLALYASMLRLSLRDLEQITASLQIFYLSAPAPLKEYTPLIVPLATIRLTHKRVYQALSSGTITTQWILDAIPELDTKKARDFVAWTQVHQMSEAEIEQLPASSLAKQLAESLGFGPDRKKLIPEICSILDLHKAEV